MFSIKLRMFLSSPSVQTTVFLSFKWTAVKFVKYLMSQSCGFPLQMFCWGFCIYVHEMSCLWFSFLWRPCQGLWYQCYADIIKPSREGCFPPLFSGWVQLEVVLFFPEIYQWHLLGWIFLHWKVFDYKFHFFNGYKNTDLKSFLYVLFSVSCISKEFVHII